jgi:hypothetical protein
MGVIHGSGNFRSSRWAIHTDCQVFGSMANGLGKVSSIRPSREGGSASHSPCGQIILSWDLNVSNAFFWHGV